MWIRVPVADLEDLEGNITWKYWNKLKSLADLHPKIHIGWLEKFEMSSINACLTIASGSIGADSTAAIRRQATGYMVSRAREGCDCSRRNICEQR